MAADVSKHLDRAKRFLEKNRVEDAIVAYLAVLDESPQHQEATQALGDLYARMDQPERAAIYYGLLFDLLVDPTQPLITGEGLALKPVIGRARTRKKRG